MARKGLLALAIAAASCPAFAYEAPFCAVTSMGAQCNFYSQSACWQAVQGIGGQCVANPAALPAAPPQPPMALPAPSYRPQPITQPNVMGSFLQGVQIGQQQRALRAAEAAPIATVPTPSVPKVDTSTAGGLAKACEYLVDVQQGTWAPGSDEDMALGLAFALECKGYINGLVAGLSSQAGMTKTAPLICTGQTPTVTIAERLARNIDKTPELADESALPYAMATMVASWKCP